LVSVVWAEAAMAAKTSERAAKLSCIFGCCGWVEWMGDRLGGEPQRGVGGRTSGVVEGALL
jgi:hypothetical protein